MRRLCKTVMGGMLLAMLAGGCGSTDGSGDDRMVMRFVSFNGLGIEQEDAVTPSSANVDAVQDICESSGDTGGTVTAEPFTNTLINAVFRNEEADNIQLSGYNVHFNDPATGLADISGNLNTLLPGGRCSDTEQKCTSDADCVTTGS